MEPDDIDENGADERAITDFDEDEFPAAEDEEADADLGDDADE